MTRQDLAALCPVCHAPTRERFRGLYDDRYGYPELFTLRECGSCGHLHVPAHFQAEDLGKLYTDYYPRGNFDIESFAPEVEKRGFSSWLNGDFASAFRWVARNVRVLDIGCGVGQTLAYHRNRGCEAHGIEADANVQPIAMRYELDIRQGVFDGTQFDPDYFDYVTLDQVAEHVVDPQALMLGVARILKPGGKVIITTPNPTGFGAHLYGRKWLNWHIPYHLQFYTRRSLGLVAERAGLAIMSCRTTTPSEWQYYQWRHVLLFPAQGERSAFWSSGEGRHLPRFWRALIGIARRLRLQAWISRLFDMTGRGDNFVFVLQKP